MAIGSLIYFPKQSKRVKPAPKKRSKQKCTVLEWIRSGYTFPGTPAPQAPAKGGAQ